MNTKSEILNWTEYFLEIAKTASKRSNCIRAQVGAVIVDNENKIKSTGYNGTPSGVISCLEKGSCYRLENNIESGTRYETCRSIHAEQNAIIQAGEERCRGAKMYLYGHDFICILCKRFIIQAGITEVYLKKNENSPIKLVTREDLQKDLSDAYSC
ncbi:MAG: dCMP deaminase family protein [Candidatus Gastranaerophilales bacterium]|nr:dCMP deaminase family protein [Candidatus Gastranaerophilales bacterium]